MTMRKISEKCTLGLRIQIKSWMKQKSLYHFFCVLQPQDDYSVLFEDTSYLEGYSPPLSVAQRYLIACKDDKKKWGRFCWTWTQSSFMRNSWHWFSKKSEKCAFQLWASLLHAAEKAWEWCRENLEGICLLFGIDFLDAIIT